MQHKLESLESRRLLAGAAAISGSVYTDVNANARHEAGEAGMKAVRVYLDANNNGSWDSQTETSALTDKRGQFRFDALSAGTYRLRQVAPTGYAVVGPRSGWFRMTLTDGQQIVRRQFANAAIAADSTPIDDQDVVIHEVLSPAKRDFIMLYRASGSGRPEALTDSVAWLSGDKTVARTEWVQRVIDGYHTYGIEYKREFLRFARAV